MQFEVCPKTPGGGTGCARLTAGGHTDGGRMQGVDRPWM